MNLIRGYVRVFYVLIPILKLFRLNGFISNHANKFRGNSSDGFSLSVYDIYLKENWSDSTFKLAVSGLWGFKLYDLLRKEKKKFVFLDIGANFGAYSILAAKNDRCIKSFAFEPNSLVYKDFIENAVRNNVKEKIAIFEFGIADYNGEKKISFNSNHLGKANFRDEGSVHEVVKVRNYLAFDELTNDIPSGLDVFCKIDVEGYESKVIDEIVKSTLSKRISKIFIEISPDWLGEDGVKHLINKIESMGLKLKWKSKSKNQYDAYFVK